MKLERSKAWYEQRIALEGDAEIGAGAPPKLKSRPAAAAAPAPAKPRRRRSQAGLLARLTRTPSSQAG